MDWFLHDNDPRHERVNHRRLIEPLPLCFDTGLLAFITQFSFTFLPYACLSFWKLVFCFFIK